MNYTTTNIQSFLGSIEPFNLLSETQLNQLSEQLTPLRYRMGQTVLLRERMPHQVAILYEGQARLLGYDPRTQMPVTLKLLEPGAILGWVSLLRGVPCETAISSTEATWMTLKSQDFLTLLENHPLLEEALKNQCSLVEVFDLLGAQLERQAQGAGNLKALAVEALSQAQVTYLSPGNTAANQLDSRLDWFVSGGTIDNFPIGSILNPEQTKSFTIKGQRPARLVGLPLGNLSLTDSAPANSSSVATQQPTEATVLESEEAEESQIEWAPQKLPDSPQLPYFDESKEKAPKRKYPFVRGKGQLDGALAVFQMLSQYFKMPFRRDVIRRVLNNQLRGKGSIPLTFCGAVTELMGLDAQLVQVPASTITRLPTPALINFHDNLAILYEISDKVAVVGVPEVGVRNYKPATFIQEWGSDGEVLLLKETKDTPQQHFGLSWFLPSLIRYRFVLIEVFVASFFVQLFTLAQPLGIQVIIDKVISQGSTDTLTFLATLLLGIAVFEAFLSTLRTYLFVDTTNRIDMTLGSEIIDHLLRLPLRYFEKRPVGELSSRINELENIRKFLTGTALTVVLDSVFSVVYIAVMILYSPLLTAVTLSTIPIFILLAVFFSPVIRQQLRTKAERNAETQSYLVEVLSGIQTVKAQNIELRTRWRWQELYARYVGAGFKNVVTSTAAGSMSGFLNKLSSLLIICVGAFLVIQGELSLGQLIAFRIIGGYVTSPLLRLAQLWQNFQEVALSLERLSDIVDTPQESSKEDRGNIPMPEITGAVKFENISFRFKKGGEWNLRNLNLELQAGHFIGIVGQSGAGKSTMTKLLVRLYDPEAGRILVDDYDIDKVELYSLRRQIGVVPQDTLLFDGTVQENIALTNPDASTEEIIYAAQVAAAHDFIMKLPSGYNTRVGERGSALSGGQRQRIAIARTVLQQPRMLIMDEATSALDYQTEQQVCSNLAEAFHDTTVFFITHRLGTVRVADVILMMHAGAVVEQGTHEELMAMKGRYYYLYMQQESQI